MSEIEWPVKRVRQTFIEFFQNKENHTFWPSCSVVPHEDPTLLFINAGMNQYKPIFTGTVDPNSPLAKLKSACNSQKCIRAGGKHNDLDDVGKDVYHHTFFEMLGNWSFANYFKKEAIAWAWELLTEVYKLPTDRLYATYCEGDQHIGGTVPCDDETRDLWLQYLPADRVLKGNMKDNFWEMGDTGPCGPCTELHFDRIGGRNAADLVNMDDPDVLEIWNVVFIQMFRNKDKSLTILPGKHVDTGMGLERITSILQDKRSNYDSDIFVPIFEAIAKKTGIRPYTGKVGKEDTDGVDMAYRVVADHIRTLTISINDGALPGSDGRNYVVRRVLRRGVRYARQYLFPQGAHYEAGFFAGLVPLVVELLGDAFPELKLNPATGFTPEKVAEIVLEEEASFVRTLDKGIQQFEKFAEQDKASGSLSGPHTFQLYDTFGFPVDLTLLMAEEKGMQVDMEAYALCMAEQKAKSRGEGKEGSKTVVLEAEQTDKIANEMGVKPTDDGAKYDWQSKGTGPKISAKVMAIFDGKAFVDAVPEGDLVGIVLDCTSFYAEAGGQLFDTGKITTADGSFTVSNVQKYGGFVLHSGELGYGSIKKGDAVTLEVDYERRSLIASNHTTTHLLNYALRKVLVGSTVDQRGSVCGPDKLRFDFSHSKPVTGDEVAKVQTIVREMIKAECDVQKQESPLAGAKQIKALRAVFGEVYPDPVRVVSVGPAEHSVAKLLAEPTNDEWDKLSVEFCGGTHLDNTREAEGFVVVMEEGTAKGVRRIVAYTKDAAARAAQAAGDYEQRIATAGSMTDMVALDVEISSLRNGLDAEPMDYARKEAIKKSIDKLKDRVIAAEKELVKAKAAAAEAWAKGLDVSGKKFVVEVVDVEGDVKAMDTAMKAVNTKAPELPAAFLSRNKAGDKVSCLVVVPKALAGTVDAKDWLNAALGECGGKGGGKPDRAQGAAKDATNFDKAVAAATAYASGKLA
uniref:Alanine--tRNA ligase n=3 Tax=Hemiselmis andersenii TaxID=464988 RepID=A0A6U4ZAK0_HEMAN